MVNAVEFRIKRPDARKVVCIITAFKKTDFRATGLTVTEIIRRKR